MFNLDPKAMHAAMNFVGKVTEPKLILEPTREDVLLRAANIPDEVANGFEAVMATGYVAGKRVRVLVMGEPGTRAALGF